MPVFITEVPEGTPVSVVDTFSAAEVELITDALVALYLRGRREEVLAFACTHTSFPFFSPAARQPASEEDR